MAHSPVTSEDGLTSEDFGESSSHSSIVNKSMITQLISNQLIEHFEENEPRNLTPEEHPISHRLFRTIQDGLKIKFLIPLI